jgi:hypothetical protein
VNKQINKEKSNNNEKKNNTKRRRRIIEKQMKNVQIKYDKS